MNTSTPGPPHPRLQVEVWSDLTCPWCWVAKRRVERAAQGFEHPGEVTVHYRSFEVDPGPVEGGRTPMAQHLAWRFGDAQQARDVMTRAVAAGVEEDMRFDFGTAVHTSTFDAHRLCHLGLDQGGPAQQAAVLERLFTAQFVEGRLLDEPDTLQRLGAEAGLDEVLLAALLAGDEYAGQVRRDEALAADLGVDTVPWVRVNDGLSAGGQLTVDGLVALLQRAWRGLGAADAGQPGAEGSVSSSN